MLCMLGPGLSLVDSTSLFLPFLRITAACLCKAACSCLAALAFLCWASCSCCNAFLCFLVSVFCTGGRGRDGGGDGDRDGDLNRFLWFLYQTLVSPVLNTQEFDFLWHSKQESLSVTVLCCNLKLR